jgi:trimethylamine-N-oxide reductase (cytochrome c), cytochrome c-type subunit TorY
MPSFQRSTVLALVVGVVVGAAGILISLEVNRATSTDALCTSCHSMAQLASDPLYLSAPHQANSAGVRPTCADCHIPRTNWFVETYTHVRSGIADMIAESTHNLSDPKIWEVRRVELVPLVRAKMHAQDSVTCRSCHDAAAIRPKSEPGRASHALLRQGTATCVDCHSNIHVRLLPSSPSVSGDGGQTK